MNCVIFYQSKKKTLYIEFQINYSKTKKKKKKVKFSALKVVKYLFE